ncbi:MAG: cell envelope biogenesis protein OmpA [Syntrophales bacterium]|jgi:outer membrane lipoprotein SlyB|nr:cell envelope biogenesis protein OmpA [Syntrophales bacterium]MDD4338216.1 cell envelope biogenesis protein OmpA [Syntrophales bacterium]HOG08288.1 cell envelope biogenesis protein OmpA [Syntrophales bacterium]HOS77745.1 cell envelope biogenesis protein OmpA [Syntrophales bacterium]HPB70303.1 cell envelope biogenesis protein OmpA [Syntrophales bacterium]
MKKILLMISILSLAGCATGPVLYPNSYLREVGEAKAHEDIAECETLADQYVQSDAGIQAAKDMAISAGGGAIIGGAAGAVVGHLGRGVGVGAATGAAAALVRGVIRASEPSPLFKSFMDRCLQERGYEVIGWQ